MIALLLSIILPVLSPQGLPSSATGTITGVLKTASGKPAAGVRVTAVARPDEPAAAGTPPAVFAASLAQTDDKGAFRLEGIPPGKYYVAAGRVDLPTYFPGTLEITNGKTIAISPTAVVANIDFVMDDASVRPVGSANSSFSIGNSDSTGNITMPVQVRMEGSGKQPILANNHPVMIVMTQVADKTRSELPLNDSSLNFPLRGAIPGKDFRVTIENLPGGYVIESITQNGVDLRNESLKITAQNFERTLTASGVRAITNVAAPMTPIEITLAAVPLPNPAASGIHVRGRASSRGPWYPNISGVPGIMFADGSFEFRDVTPGRHVIILQDRPETPFRLLAASVVVGSKDLDEVETDDTLILPSEIRFPARTPEPGSIPLASIHGTVLDEVSRRPVFGGVVTISGKNKTDFSIDSEGLFEIPRLLPGTYDLTIAGSEHAAVHQSIVVGDDDIPLQVSTHATP